LGDNKALPVRLTFAENWRSTSRKQYWFVEFESLGDLSMAALTHQWIVDTAGQPIGFGSGSTLFIPKAYACELIGSKAYVRVLIGSQLATLNR
jgi:hypothetical protein